MKGKKARGADRLVPCTAYRAHRRCRGRSGSQNGLGAGKGTLRQSRRRPRLFAQPHVNCWLADGSNLCGVPCLLWARPATGHTTLGATWSVPPPVHSTVTHAAPAHDPGEFERYATPRSSVKVNALARDVDPVPRGLSGRSTRPTCTRFGPLQGGLEPDTRRTQDFGGPATLEALVAVVDRAPPPLRASRESRT
jgi:hypothetical protein